MKYRLLHKSYPSPTLRYRWKLLRAVTEHGIRSTHELAGRCARQRESAEQRAV